MGEFEVEGRAASPRSSIYHQRRRGPSRWARSSTRSSATRPARSSTTSPCTGGRRPLHAHRQRREHSTRTGLMLTKSRKARQGRALAQRGPGGHGAHRGAGPEGRGARRRLADRDVTAIGYYRFRAGPSPRADADSRARATRARTASSCTRPRIGRGTSGRRSSRRAAPTASRRSGSGTRHAAARDEVRALNGNDLDDTTNPLERGSAGSSSRKGDFIAARRSEKIRAEACGGGWSAIEMADKAVARQRLPPC